ncbi:YozE family protein [Streptomyces sp. NPDC032472]|uniref:YozE family protein n=1 Tax=Streptomyces sp. NPDC032472 TaxID=3155018 RepID=UPI0033C0FCB2
MGGFREWLLAHLKNQDAIGELARKAASDPDWPEGPDRLKTSDHLESSGATRALLEDLPDAWIRCAAR